MFRPSSSVDPALKCPEAMGERSCKPILLLLHQKYSSAGAIGIWLEQHGFRLDIKHPTLGDKLPKTLQKHAGLIVFGGSMSANDENSEITTEIKWLDVVLKEKIPFLGICLGAQMMVRSLGGQVTAHEKSFVEVGYCPLSPTEQGKKLLKYWPKKTFQWHREGFSLPTGAIQLASGTLFENLAFIYDDHVIGLQFHPEVTSTIISRWSKTNQKMMKEKGAHNLERLLVDHQKYKQSQRDWLHQFMMVWTSSLKVS